MFVCICHGVTDTEIKTSIEEGATTYKQLQTELKVGTQCGKCCRCTKHILNNKLMEIAEPLAIVA